MQTEHVILLNAQGVPTGTLEKYAAHTADTLLHLAFSSWLFNAKGQLLVTRRALSKKAWPGVWTNSVCGHPQLGESNEDAVIRRCRYELGVEITPPESIYPDFRYRATDPNGIVENEVCPVFAARTNSALQINDDEVMDYQWCDLADVLHGIDAAAAAGVTCVIQPGGSIRDDEVIAAADEHGIAMLFTDMRHFRH
eukprot:981566_1